MEVELPKEDTPFEIPPGIEIIREVTGIADIKTNLLQGLFRMTIFDVMCAVPSQQKSII